MQISAAWISILKDLSAISRNKVFARPAKGPATRRAFSLCKPVPASLAPVWPAATQAIGEQTVSITAANAPLPCQNIGYGTSHCFHFADKQPGGCNPTFYHSTTRRFIRQGQPPVPAPHRRLLPPYRDNRPQAGHRARAKAPWQTATFGYDVPVM